METLGEMRAKAERLAIQKALDKSGGNRSEAADLLGISERTLYRKLDEHDLHSANLGLGGSGAGPGGGLLADVLES